eukprot:9477093-Pyramimonas_sp.AAC.1
MRTRKAIAWTCVLIRIPRSPPQKSCRRQEQARHRHCESARLSLPCPSLTMAGKGLGTMFQDRADRPS